MIAATDLVFLRALQKSTARHLMRCPAISREIAAEEATGGAQILAAMIDDGEAIVMEPNIICRELAAGITPEEFRHGPVFYGGKVA